ncbi:MAG: LuxR C-terminal-related transcriptional regulator [Akkermansiaceae bacterium]|nr:LuxR C-terminal-related transcriptional regulator [Akkermansiaceae bacterium]MCF7730728.1 LuxR C-terminal-related transcriptional regulator [Akkermansiaceae bacterium]
MPKAIQKRGDGILTTKLNPPLIRSDILDRPQLLERLERDVHRPLTLIAAPAGYGKSTLVAQWLQTSTLPGVWISLDEGDTNPRTFLSYLVAAVRRFKKDACTRIHDLLGAAQLPPAEILAMLLANDLEEIEEPFLLVLDDYHRADSHPINRFTECLLSHPSRLLHLVLITRRDPPLPLARLRAQGAMTEIREHDLRFSCEETGEMIRNGAQCTVREATITRLHKELEGWIVGVRLACLALRGRDDPDSFLEKLSGGTGGVQDYLTEEVIGRLDHDFMQCLMKISILDRFNASVCEAVFKSCPGDGKPGPKNGIEFLQHIQNANLFMVGLDPRDEWFRFHHQFQRLLQRQLQRRMAASQIAQLHSAAATWFADDGLTDEAVRHALAAGDVEHAAEIVEDSRRAELDEDRWRGVDRWLNQLPDDVKQQRPEILLAEAWVAYLTLQTARIPSLVERVELLLEEVAKPDPFWLAELNFFKAVVHYWGGEGEESKRCCETALELFGEKRGMLGGEVRLYLALARNLCGEARQAVEAIEQDFRVDDIGDFAFSTRAMAAKSFVHLLTGDLAPAARVAERLLIIAQRWPSKYAEAWSWFALGIARHHRHETEEAVKAFHEVIRLRDFFEKRGVIDAYGGLMISLQLMGRSDQASAVAGELADYARCLTDPECEVVEASCQARLALLRGDLKRARGWARSVEKGAPDIGMLFWTEEPSVTLARVFIAEGRKAGLEKANQLLDTLCQQAEARHLTCHLVDLMVLQAAALERRKRRKEATEKLEEAVELAQTGGWIRPFVEVGTILTYTLQTLAGRESTGVFTTQVLAILGIDPAPISTAVPLLEPLTHRELDVLELLAERLYDKEIAERLSIAPETVRSHLKHLYGKLGVGDRRSAVEQGRIRGVLKARRQ